MDKKQIRYALVGCGSIAPNHIKAALENDLDIVAVCDVVEENRNKILELIPEEKRVNVKAYSDYKEMLVELKPELVALAVGSGIKKMMAVDCMNNGANIIVEKPLALSLQECDEMIEAAEKNDVLLCVNHQLRFGKTMRALKATVESGNMGRLLYGTVQVRRNRNEAYFQAAKWRGTWKQDGGTLMNQCIHYTDLLQWVMDSDVTEVFAYTDRMTHPYIEAEDLGLAMVKFANGAYGVIEGSVNTYPQNLSDSMALFGETGTVSLDGKTLDDVKAWNVSGDTATREAAFEKYNIEDLGAGHIPFYANVIGTIRKECEPLCTAIEGRKAVELILAIYKSAAEGKPVTLPLKDCSTMDFVGRFE